MKPDLASAPVPESTKPDRRWASAVEMAALGLAAVLVLALLRYHWQYVADDAFIAFRYVRNLLDGNGLVWNAGQPVEGFSSPLWLGLLALGGAAGLPLTTWAGGLGVLFLVLVLVLVHRLTWTLAHDGVAAALACLVAALTYPLHYWSTAGLETTLFVALVTAAVWALVVDSPRWWPAVAACLGVARPEGPFLVLALLALAALAHGPKAVRPRKVAVALLPMLGWLLFRRIYYNDWLPNPYYAKATGALVARIEAGLIYAIWALVAWAAVTAAVWLAGGLTRKIAAALALLAFALGMIVAEGGDWMWHARMTVPLLPAMIALVAAAVARATSHRRWAALLAFVLAWAAFAPKPSLLLAVLTGGRMPPGEFQEGTLARASSEVAAFIGSHYPKTAVVAVNHAGALPYALPNPAIDMSGLCDWHIAHERQGGVHHKFDAAYVFARKPDLVVLNTVVKPGTDGIWYHPGYWEGETALVKQPGWAESYRPVDEVWESHWLPGVRTYLVLFERIAGSP
jgi:arabinofuranosyltransferase